jgi:uncharacterized protein YukE
MTCQFSEYLVGRYTITFLRARADRMTLRDAFEDGSANINKRIAAVRLYAQRRAQNDYDDVYSMADTLRELVRSADAQGARALADEAHDLADDLEQCAEEIRERRQAYASRWRWGA